MADILGDVIDIALYGNNIDIGEEISNPLLSTYGYIAFAPTSTDYIANHTEKALDLLIEQFRKDKPLLHGFIAAFTDNMQGIEDTLFDMSRFRSLNTATGTQLDNIGTILNLPRTNSDDEIYRSDLLFQVYLNTSFGTPETLIQAVDKLTNAKTVDYVESYPASVILIVNQALIVIPENIREKLEQITPAGVQLYIYLNNSETPFIFGGEGGFSPAYTVGAGFGETGIAWVDVGGNLTELIS